MWFNDIMLGIINSPVHGMMSGSIMALTYTGRKSGKSYTTPVNYIRERLPNGGERLWTLSERDRTWWRNFRGGARATLGIQRNSFPVIGYAIEEPAAVEEALAHYLEMSPGTARFVHVTKANGVIDVASLKAAAQKQVLVYFELVEDIEEV